MAIRRSMPATARAIPMCWTPRPCKRYAAWTIPAAAFSIRSSPDGGGDASAAGGRLGCGTCLRRAGVPAGGRAEGDALARAAGCDRQLPAFAALYGRAGCRAVAAGGSDPGGVAFVGAAAPMAGLSSDGLVDAVCRGHGDQS